MYIDLSDKEEFQVGLRQLSEGIWRTTDSTTEGTEDSVRSLFVKPVNLDNPKEEETKAQIRLTPRTLVPFSPVALESSPQLCSRLQISQFCHVDENIKPLKRKGEDPGFMNNASVKCAPDGFVLAYSVDSILRLLLNSRVPPRVHQKYLV